jgi:cell division protein FtsL
MQGMGQMGDMESMKRMADMCQQMMQREKAAMPFVIGTSVLFGVLLFLALLLLLVLEIQWIKYWARLLQAQKGHPNGSAKE